MTKAALHTEASALEVGVQSQTLHCEGRRLPLPALQFRGRGCSAPTPLILVVGGAILCPVGS